MAEGEAQRKRERAAALKRKFQKLDGEAVKADLDALAKSHPQLVPRVIEYYEHLVEKMGPGSDGSIDFITPPCAKMKRSPSSTSLGSVGTGASVSGSCKVGTDELGSVEGEETETKLSSKVTAVSAASNGIAGKKLSAYTADELALMLAAVEPGVFAREVLKA
eukprot:2049737-Amphidinium_carterae.1